MGVHIYRTSVCVSIALLSLARVPGAQPAVTLEKMAKCYRVQGPLYTVDVRADGCLAGLQVESEDFLPPPGRGAAGGYLYRRGY